MEWVGRWYIYETAKQRVEKGKEMELGMGGSAAARHRDRGNY
jgi:hypothetical protein